MDADPRTALRAPVVHEVLQLQRRRKPLAGDDAAPDQDLAQTRRRRQARLDHAPLQAERVAHLVFRGQAPDDDQAAQHLAGVVRAPEGLHLQLQEPVEIARGQVVPLEEQLADPPRRLAILVRQHFAELFPGDQAVAARQASQQQFARGGRAPEHDAAGTGRQELQDPELRRRERKGPAPVGDFLPALVDQEVAVAHDRGHVQAGGRPAEPRPHPRHQLLHAEGLGHVIVRPGVQAANTLFLLHPGGEHDHRHVRRALLPSQAPADLYPVGPGHHAVEQDEVGGPRHRELEARLPVEGAKNLEAFGFEVVADEVHQVALVVDDQDGASRHIDLLR